MFTKAMTLYDILPTFFIYRVFLQCRRMRRKTVVSCWQGREQCCQQVNTRTTVYTLPGSSKEHQQEQRRQGVGPGVGPGVGQEQEQEPVYQEIRELQKQKKKLQKESQKEVHEEPSWAPSPAVVYGLITAKEVARYVPPNSGLVRPEK